MTLADLQRAARDAIADYDALAARIDEHFAADPLFTPARRAALLGPRPRWAEYVCGLGAPAVGSATRAQLEISLGSAKNMRAFALNILRIADIVDPVEFTP